jgi:uncharacterized protein (TIGR02145 family)
MSYRLFISLFALMTCLYSSINLSGQQPYSRTGKDHALLFAIKDYQHWGDLKNPIRDAEAIAQVLEHKYGFAASNIDIVKNPTKKEIYRTIQQYLNRDFEEDEQLFIYFSGHGEFVPYPNNLEEGKGYFIPSDAIRNDPYRESYISWINLLPDIDAISCKHIMLVVDACYSGSILTRHDGRPHELSQAEQFFRSVLPYHTRLVITSGGKERSFDGKHRSPLTEKLLAGFASHGGNNGVLSFYELLGFLQGIKPRSRSGSFGKHDPNGDFLFLYQSETAPSKEEKFVIDTDGNHYSIVQLGGLKWLGENLNLNVPGSYCFLSESDNCSEFGRLYTWYAAKEACRSLGKGWRLPKIEEWEKTINKYGSIYPNNNTVKNKALLKGGESGINLSAGGFRYPAPSPTGTFYHLGETGTYWSSSSKDYQNAWYFDIRIRKPVIYKNDNPKLNAFSCRCVKD